jgi:hypothetical protein
MADIPDNGRLDTVQKTLDRRHSIFNIASIVFGAAVPIIALVPGLWGGDSKASWAIAAAGISGAISPLLRSIDGFQKNKDE